MPRLIALPLTLAITFLIAAWAESPPSPRPASAAGFSAERGVDILKTVAATPHVSGSPAAARVRGWLVGELRRAGLQVEVQHAFAARQSAKWAGILAAPVDNVVAVLPGRDRAAPAVLLMAHYDAVPYSFGAGDDGAGVAALLDTARALARGPRPARDVIFLLTDGEELGLLGATGFFDQHPLARQVGVVVNAEARGSAGRATMFQTSPGNAALVGLWATHAPHPTGTSLTDAVYKLLPNDTDLSVSLEHGVPGINAAFVGGQFDYHNPTDNLADLDRGSLQHLGDFARSTTQALAFADALPARGGDATYFDLFGLTVARYPTALGWLLLAAGGIFIVLATTRARVAPWRVAVGLLGGLLVVAGAAGWVTLAAAVAAGHGVIGERNILAEMTPLLVLYGLIAVWWTLWMLRYFARTLPGAWGLWLGAMLLALILGGAMQFYVPGGAYVFEWPLLVAGGVALVAARRGIDSPAGRWTAALAGGLVFALAAQLAHQIHISLGSQLPGLLALTVLHGLLLLFPLVVPWTARGPNIGGRLALLAGIAITALIVARPGFSPRHSRPGDLMHLTDRSEGFWASSSGRDELPPGPMATRDLAPLSGAGWAVTPSGRTTADPVRVSLVPADGGHATLRVTAQPLLSLRLAIRSAKPLLDARLNGVPVRLKAGDWTPIRYGSASPADLALSFVRPPGTRIEVRWLSATPGLPSGAPRPTGAPTNWTLFSGSSVVTGGATFAPQ